MSSSTGGGGGVSNIRALFELKQEKSSSPPSRGRSPAAISDINSIRSTSSRPVSVSQIRTSFVAVEKSGQMGGPILGLRRVSDVQDKLENEENPRPSITRSVSNAGREQIAEEEEKEKKKEDTTAAMKIERSEESSKDMEAQVNGFEKTSKIGNRLRGKAAEVKTSIEQVSDAVKNQEKVEITKAQSSKSTTSALAKKQPNATKEIPGRSKIVKKPAPVDTKPSANATISAANRATRTTPTNPKTPTTATKPPAKRDIVSKSDSCVSTPRASLAPNGLKENKAIKTRPKSPTKPVRLPAAAMASTASSAAKTAADQPVSRSFTKPRTSTDGGFLARMMRPTAASASKTHEKVTPKTTPQKTMASRSKKTSEVGERTSIGKTELSETSRKTSSSHPDDVVLAPNEASENNEKEEDKRKTTGKSSTSDQLKLAEIQNSGSDKDDLERTSEKTTSAAPIESTAEESRALEPSISPPSPVSKMPLRQDTDKSLADAEPERHASLELAQDSVHSKSENASPIPDHDTALKDEEDTQIPDANHKGDQRAAEIKHDDTNEGHDILEFKEHAETAVGLSASEKTSEAAVEDVSDNDHTEDVSGDSSGQKEVDPVKDRTINTDNHTSIENNLDKEGLPAAVEEPKQDKKSTQATTEHTSPKIPDEDTRSSSAKLGAEIHEEVVEESY